MGNLEKYQTIIEKILNDYAAIPYKYGEVERRTIFDRRKNNFLLYIVGWDTGERVHGTLIHADIIDGKIYIQRDGTEDGIATDLEAAGVPKSDIVLAFHEPEMRKYTEYAVA